MINLRTDASKLRSVVGKLDLTPFDKGIIETSKAI